VRIVAWAHDGALYCTDCADGSEPNTGYGPNPVFSTPAPPTLTRRRKPPLRGRFLR